MYVCGEEGNQSKPINKHTPYFITNNSDQTHTLRNSSEKLYAFKF